MLKKVISLILMACMVLLSMTSVFQVSAALKGDVNGNNKVNGTDYLLIKRHVFGIKSLTASQKAAADFDADGDVDRADYMMLKRYVYGTLEATVSNVHKMPISIGKSYTKSVSANATYPDNKNSEMTDGNMSVAPDFTNEAYSGFQSNIEVVIDLGSSNYDICGFEISYLNDAPTGIYNPTSFAVYGGNTTSCTTELGSVAISRTGETIKGVTSLNLETYANYRYIKFSVTKGSAGWIFIDELVIYGMVDDQSGNSNSFKTSGMTDSQMSSQLSQVASSKRYNTAIGSSPVLDNTYTINCSSYDDRTHSNKIQNKYNIVLNDGQDTGAGYGVDSWVGISASKASSIVVNVSNNGRALDNICGFTVYCFNRPSVNINLPAYVDVSVSSNGSTYYKVGRIFAPNNDIENHTFALHLNTLVKGSYVKFEFPVGYGYYWLEEVEVYTNTSSDSNLSQTGYLAPSNNVLGGAEDVALIYFNSGTVDENMLLPYVGYLDKNGSVIDTMYDGFLFLPAVGQMQSNGSTPYGTNYANDWNWMFDNIFMSNRNISALDKAAEKVKFLLNKPDYKLKVFVTIPHMDPTLSNFGDIDGDGDSENLTIQSQRVYVAKYFAQKVIQKFNSMNYKNIELCGFYWFHESINSTDGAIAKEVNKAFDQMGVQMFWIPFYGAEGFLKGYDYGFDAVCLQPNYAFELDVSESRLAFAANYANQKNMCIEMEIAYQALADYRYFQKYMNYLSGGVKYGYMNNSIHMYYQDFDVIGSAWESESERVRLIYTYTYEFIKGKLNVKPAATSNISITANKNETVGGSVNIESTDTKMYSLSTSPSHGSIAFSNDGSFVYYPNDNYTGTDTFKYRISNYLGWSEECTVTVKVG